MTEDERARLFNSLQEVQIALSNIPFEIIDDEENLYQKFKTLHTAALGPYCTLIQIWETRRGLNSTQRRLSDAINLNELFGEKENTCDN